MSYQKVIRYKVKADKAAENIIYIQSLFAALASGKPDHLRYVVLQAEDGLSFMHIAFVETEDDSNPLAQFDEFKAWTDDIYERCDEPPSFSDVVTIGSYRALA